MNTEQLLQSTCEEKSISIDLDVIENMGQFQTGKNECSSMSIALILNNHQAIKKYSFDYQKFKEWCYNNELMEYIDKYNRIVYLKRKKYIKYSMPY